MYTWCYHVVSIDRVNGYLAPSKSAKPMPKKKKKGIKEAEKSHRTKLWL